MLFLFDDADLQSVLRDCRDWKHAEERAEHENLTLIGEFVSWVDADTLEETYVN